MLNGDEWVQDIKGALTVQVIVEFLQVWDLTRNIHLHAAVKDSGKCKWTPDKVFTTSSAYHAFFTGQQAVLGTKVWRKARAPAKCKFFVWLMLHDRCWTAERRKCHNLQDDDSCALCNQEPETISHLLVGCATSRAVWFSIFSRLGWQDATPMPTAPCFVDWWTNGRKGRPREARRCFDTLVILISWLIWKERNRRVFDHQASQEELLSLVGDKVTLWLQAGFRQLEVVSVALGRNIAPM